MSRVALSSSVVVVSLVALIGCAPAAEGELPLDPQGGSDGERGRVRPDDDDVIVKRPGARPGEDDGEDDADGDAGAPIPDPDADPDPAADPDPDPNPDADPDPDPDPAADPDADPDPAPDPDADPDADPDPAPDPDADPDPEPEPPPPPAPATLSIAHGVDVGGFDSSVYTWLDAHGQPRSAAMVRNDVADPTGNHGGGMRRMTYVVDGETRTATGHTQKHPVFGYATSHFPGSVASTRHVAGDHRVLFAGDHHAVHEYTWRMAIGPGDVDVTVWWTFASGRDHPLYAVTYDARPAGPNVVNGDSRAPYGDLNFDDDQNLPISGVGWGDRHRFRTTGAGPVTMGSGWTYEATNRVPHVLSWVTSADAEMGLVQTLDWTRKDAGGMSFYQSWGTSSSGPLPADWNWPFQLNQYELPSTTRSHRMAWGTNYGAVGQTSYPSYGDDEELSGYPFQSYAVFVALGARGLVDEVVSDVEALLDADFTCSVGSVVASVEGGAGRDDVVAADPPGYHPVFASYEARADGNAFACTLDLGSEQVTSPLVRVRGYTASSPPAVDAAGDVYVSLDDERDVLWITLAGARTGRVTVAAE